MKSTRVVPVVLALAVAGGACVSLVGDFEVPCDTDMAGNGGGCAAAGGMVCPSGQSCTTNGCADWADWPMPNPAEITDAGLPNPASYDTMTEPGVVVDNVTCLWWQQPIDVPNDKGMSCSAGCTPAAASQYCADLTLAGHGDWRLPTRIELVSIVDDATYSPAINAAFAGTPSLPFVTSTAGPAQGVVWTVEFHDGYTSASASTGPFRVRCVR